MWGMQSRRFTKQEAIDIFTSPERAQDLADRYGVKKSTIDSLRRSVTYKWATFGLQPTCKRGRPKGSKTGARKPAPVEVLERKEEFQEVAGKTIVLHQVARTDS